MLVGRHMVNVAKRKQDADIRKTMGLWQYVKQRKIPPRTWLTVSGPNRFQILG